MGKKKRKVRTEDLLKALEEERFMIAEDTRGYLLEIPSLGVRRRLTLSYRDGYWRWSFSLAGELYSSSFKKTTKGKPDRPKVFDSIAKWAKRRLRRKFRDDALFQGVGSLDLADALQSEIQQFAEELQKEALRVVLSRLKSESQRLLGELRSEEHARAVRATINEPKEDTFGSPERGQESGDSSGRSDSWNSMLKRLLNKRS